MGHGKTVLLLGAGASTASEFRLPTMAGFFVDNLGAWPDLRSYLKSFYPRKSAKRYNLEEVLAHRDLSRVRLPLWEYARREPPNAEKSIAFEDILDFVKKRLAIPPAGVCSLHKRLFQTLNPDDSIITLNYDLIADYALRELEKHEHGQIGDQTRTSRLLALIGAVGFLGGRTPPVTPVQAERGYYIKLHGSLNWLFCPNPGCECNTNYRVQDEPSDGKICGVCGSTLQVFLVPPVATKRLEERSRMALLWRLAFTQIAQATKLVIIGVSLAPSDFELRWLIREAIRNRSQKSVYVHIVNPTRQHRKRVRELLPGSGVITFEHKYIEDYLNRNLEGDKGSNEGQTLTHHTET